MCPEELSAQNLLRQKLRKSVVGRTDMKEMLK